MISSVTQAFCSDCSRIRLSTEGKLYTCLFATRGHDLRALLRDGRSDEEIVQRHRPAVARRARPVFRDPHQSTRTACARQQNRNVLYRGIVCQMKTSIDQRPGTGRRTRHAHGQRRQGPAAVSRLDHGGARAGNAWRRRWPASPSTPTRTWSLRRPGVPVWPDDTPGFAGPLAGLKVGLRRCDRAYLLTAPCDSPFLPADLAERLRPACRRAENADLAWR
jgi:hypothetical protein